MFTNNVDITIIFISYSLLYVLYLSWDKVSLSFILYSSYKCITFSRGIFVKFRAVIVIRLSSSYFNFQFSVLYSKRRHLIREYNGRKRRNVWRKQFVRIQLQGTVQRNEKEIETIDLRKFYAHNLLKKTTLGT